MARLAKYLSLCLAVILVLCNLIMIESASGQTIPKPSIPEFSVVVVDHSYIVPESTSIDPYNGSVITHPAYLVENKTIDITIRNQPFASNDELIDLFFNIRLKGAFENTWTELYHITNRTNDNTLLRQSGNEFTVKSLPQSFPANGSVDFQVEAFIAVGHRFSYTNFGYWTWEESGWSPTQTITIADHSFSSSITTVSYPSLSPISTATPTISPSPSPTESPSTVSPTSPPNTNLELTITLTWIVIGILVISVISLLLFTKHLKSIKPTSNIIKN